MKGELLRVKIKRVVQATLVVIVIGCCSLGCILASRMLRIAEKPMIGEQAVRLLYEFGSPEQLDSQMVQLKQITSDDVFAQLTIDNEKRTLNTYLKFKQDPVTINVLESTSTYVVYTINNLNIDPTRKFIFRYEIEDGKIIKAKEAELIEFADYFD